MINGKFFSGLTPKMLDRNTGPNRQQSNLFWPDESDVESASESRSKRRQKTTQQSSISSNSPCNTDLDTRELIKKQLTSKIEFYDIVDDTPIKNNVNTSTVQPTVEETSARKNKLEGFTSKIEFYDYADDVKANLPKTDKNSKQDVERNSKNSPKTIDKKIKFIENVSADTEIAQPKGILRNNEKSSQEQSRKRLIKKRNLSKSVENLSFRAQDLSDDEDDCIKVIENDVKNVAINDHKLREKEGRQSSRKEEFANYRSGRSNIKVDRPQTPINHNYDDGLDSPEEQIDENFYRKSNREQTVIYHEVRQDSHSDRADSDRGNSARSATAHPPTQHQFRNDNFSRIEKPINSQNSSARSQQSDQPPPDQQPLQNRSHRHLQSSIFFGNDIEPTADRPPKSVRSSAVMRVSVGLPD